MKKKSSSNFSHSTKISLSLLALLLAASFLLPSKSHSVSDKDLAKASVMIRNTQKNSGGTGAIIRSFPDHSLILTNKHVCGVVRDGGYVTTDDNSDHLVIGYKEATNHDLCLVEVAEDLGITTEISPVAPRAYDSATVVGHPALYPTVITKGHFTRKTVIKVNIGKEACTPADYANPDTALFCALFGGKLLLKDYETIMVTATIMPGSSGSPVYNDKGQIAAVIFAGAGDLGYGFAVPLEYVRNFVNSVLESSN